MTFLEVVLGVTLLGLVASTLTMATGAIGSSFQRQRDRLGAAEIASRLLLMRADDEETLPMQTESIPYGERMFRWTMEEGPVTVLLSEPARAAIASGQTSNTTDLSRRMISVKVTAWLGEETGGTVQFDPDVPHYTLTRLVDPIDFLTSDSAERRLETQEDLSNFMGDFMGSMSGSGEGAVGGGGSRAQPQRERTGTPPAGATPRSGGGQRGGGG